MIAMTRRDLLRLIAASGAAVAPQMVTSQSLAGRPITVDAQPKQVVIDTAKTIVVVVDMQNDFCSKGGVMDRAGIDVSGIRSTIPRIAAVLAAARRASIRIVYLKMGFKADLSDLGAADSLNRAEHLAIGVGQSTIAPDGTPSRVLVRDTWNTDVIPELSPHTGDLVLYKTRFSGFYNTDLHERLTAMGIRHLVFTGCTTSVCVESTLRDAMFRDYLPVLLSDCTNEVFGNDDHRTNHQATVNAVQNRFGWVSNSDSFARALAM